jgi:nucleoside-diphosphate-sugar epimerase
MKEYKNKNVLVTGGTGFIGSRLTERLHIEEKANVTVMVHKWERATWVSRLDINLIQGDITDPEAVNKAIEGKDVVFHCVGVGGSLDQAMKINYNGTQNVLNACKKHGVKRIVFLSSIVVHGAGVFDNMDETAPYVDTDNPYAMAKLETEKYFLNFISENNIEGSVIRPTLVWGPVSPYYTAGIIGQMKDNSFMLVDKGAGSCNAVHVDNVVDLTLICGYHKSAIGESFLITDGERFSWKDFWGNFAQMLDVDITQFTSVPSRNNFRREISLELKRFIMSVWIFLNKIIDKKEPKYPSTTKYILKAPRKIVKMMYRSLDKLVPEMDAWDTELYGSTGFISLEKSKNLLGYTPRVSVEQGMNDCRLWLSSQNYL